MVVGPSRQVDSISLVVIVGCLIMSRSRSSKKRKIVDEDDLSSEESAAGEYNVERIIGHHGNPSKVSTLRFQVRWEGYDAKSDTWEPYKNVSDCSAFDDYVRASPALAAALSVKSATPKRDKKDPATPSAN